jgi:hypothetical protein
MFIVVVPSPTHSLLTFILHLRVWDSISLSYLVLTFGVHCEAQTTNDSWSPRIGDIVHMDRIILQPMMM